MAKPHKPKHEETDWREDWERYQQRYPRSTDPEPIAAGSATSRYRPPPPEFKAPDWVRWLNTPEAEVWQCVAVCAGIDPDAHGLAEIEKYAGSTDSDARHDPKARVRRAAAQAFVRRLRIVCANVKEIADARLVLGHPELIAMNLLRCARWLHDRGLDPVAELVELHAASAGSNATPAAEAGNGRPSRADRRGPGSAPESVQPVTSKKIMACFAVSKDPTDSDAWWDLRMREARRYRLAECRVSKGRGRVQSMWRPDLVAAWLVEHGHMPAKDVAQVLRRNFTDCSDAADRLAPPKLD